MTDSLYIAWRYIGFYWGRSATLVSCITLIALLPLALELILHESERQLIARAEATPLIVGAKGSALDLVMNSLYFSNEIPETITMGALNRISETGLAAPIPLYVRFHARGFPIVGTTLDYFDFRGLEIGEGHHFGVLGECVIGATVAQTLGLEPGDHLLSSPETVFDLAGIYPLKMKVSGVLRHTHSADDLAVLVDVKTAWIIQGLGHGHEDLTRTRDTSVILERNEGNVTANAKLKQYTEITSANLDSFHVHGDLSGFPVTSVIALPHDERSGTILRGRFLDRDDTLQIIRPAGVIDTLMANIFRIRNVLDAVIFTVGTATLLALVLVFALSLRLRQREIETIFKIGCSRATTLRLLGAEILIILSISAGLCAGLLAIVAHYDQILVRAWFM